MFLILLNILLFNVVNEQLFETLFYRSVIIIFILVIFLDYLYSNSTNLKTFIIDIHQKFEMRAFENDSQSKQIINYNIKNSQFQKQAEESNRKIQDLGLIFSGQNVIHERQVRKQTQKIRGSNKKLQKVVFSFLTILFFISNAYEAFSQTLPEIILTSSKNIKEQNITPFLQIYNGTHPENISFNDLRNKNLNHFVELKDGISNLEKNVRWFRFNINNTLNENFDFKISIIFTDKISIYSLDENGNFQFQSTGDLVPVSERNPSIGQMVFAKIPVYSNRNNPYYIRLESRTNISRQFKSLAVKSVMIYSQNRFEKLFIDSRLYQSAFYGAIIVIFLYNLFVFFSLRNQFSFLYLLFLLTFVIFLASNNGFLAETILDKYPRLDLYIRFLSTPFLLLFYTLFSKSYLKLKDYSPVINQIINYWMVFLILIIVVMLSGYWAVGRTIVTFSGIFNFIFIGLVAVNSLKKGFIPAKYFLAANILFIFSGVLFALQRINFVVYDPLNQYQTQISAILQISLFSLGLAERIQLVRKELIEKTVENVRLERQKELELKNLAEEKNQALQNVVDELDMFIYKIAHDIRGPIARVMGLSKVALMDIENEAARNYFNLLEKESFNLSDILKRLSTVYEINHLTIKKEKINLNAVIENLLTEIKNDYDIGNTIFKIEIINQLEIITDKFIIELILKNLIENAVKFKNSLDSLIIVNIEINKESYLISVIDNGIGISPQNNKIIFDMFSRAAGIHKSTGLGLYMTKLAAEKLMGNIQLVKNPDGFTQFTVNLPK